MPANLDPDENGSPCESEYSAAETSDVFGKHEGLSVRLVSDLPAGTFAATGPAVEADIMCSAGTTEFTPDTDPTREDAIGHWEDLYTCDDGSGTFIIGVDIFTLVGGTEYGVWNIGSGTGIYQAVTGGGHTQTGPTGPETWSDDSIGSCSKETAASKRGKDWICAVSVSNQNMLLAGIDDVRIDPAD
jgi:hypothetical protein